MWYTKKESSDAMHQFQSSLVAKKNVPIARTVVSDPAEVFLC